MTDAVTVACKGPHEPVSHRDARRPWCDVCRRYKDGTPVIQPAADVRTATRPTDGEERR